MWKMKKPQPLKFGMRFLTKSCEHRFPVGTVVIYATENENNVPSKNDLFDHSSRFYVDPKLNTSIVPIIIAWDKLKKFHE